MPTSTTVTTTRTSNVAVHTISFRGLAGAIFCLVSLATVLYVIGFSTIAWTIYGNSHHGLWRWCSCTDYRIASEGYKKATQALITIGLIGLLIAFLLVCLYMCIHSISKNSTILALVIVLFLSVLFILIGLIVYGAKAPNVSWSYIVTVVAGILTLVAGILAVLQMRESGVRV